MAEMTIEEAKEIIGTLLDAWEASLVLCGAYKVVATVEGKIGWESRVEHQQELIAPRFAEALLPLRELLLSASPAHTSYTNWHQIVQSLLESVKDFDPSD